MSGDVLSSTLGWVSIACWIVVYSPQIIENYRLKSGEGLSVLFIIIWLLGDMCNLVGALMAGLLPTVILIAVYYSLCDSILLFQIYYYRHTNPVILVTPTPSVIVSNEEGEEAPLLGAHREVVEQKAAEHPSRLKAFLQYLPALVFVITTGVVAWSVNQQRGSKIDPTRPKDVIDWKSQVIGWTAAVLYLGSRIPQILKNFKTKCEGLSMALFLFAIAGNVTYVLSICADSMDRQHLIANASWLAGSGLTVFLDVFVLAQFFYFHSAKRVFISEHASR